MVRFDTEISQTHPSTKPLKGGEESGRHTGDKSNNIKALSMESFITTFFFFPVTKMLSEMTIFVSPDDALLAFGYKP